MLDPHAADALEDRCEFAHGSLEKNTVYFSNDPNATLKTIYYVNLFFRFASSSLYTFVHFPPTLRLSLAQFASLQMFFWVATWRARAWAASRASWRPYFVIQTLF